MMRYWQLLLAACWASIALIVVFRHELGLAALGFGETRWWLMLALSCLLTVWNLVRWAAQQAVKPRANPLEFRAEQPPPFEYNPDLDFQKQQRDRGESAG